MEWRAGDQGGSGTHLSPLPLPVMFCHSAKNKGAFWKTKRRTLTARTWRVSHPGFRLSYVKATYHQILHIPNLEPIHAGLQPETQSVLRAAGREDRDDINPRTQRLQKVWPTHFPGPSGESLEREP